MRSSVDADSWKNNFAPKPTVKLGSEKNPAVVRVQSELRFKEVSATFAKHGWECRISIEPDKAEDVADLERLHQHKVVGHEHDGGTTYVYADAAGCKCLYTGNQDNYDQFEKLRVQENVASQEMMAAEMNQQAAMNWEMWGPW